MKLNILAIRTSIFLTNSYDCLLETTEPHLLMIRFTAIKMYRGVPPFLHLFNPLLVDFLRDKKNLVPAIIVLQIHHQSKSLLREYRMLHRLVEMQRHFLLYEADLIYPLVLLPPSL